MRRLVFLVLVSVAAGCGGGRSPIECRTHDNCNLQMTARVIHRQSANRIGARTQTSIAQPAGVGRIWMLATD